jgi:hypothetical protein
MMEIHLTMEIHLMMEIHFDDEDTFDDEDAFVSSPLDISHSYMYFIRYSEIHNCLGWFY